MPTPQVTYRLRNDAGLDLPANTNYDGLSFSIQPEPRDRGNVYTYLLRLLGVADKTLGRVTYTIKEMLPNNQQYSIRLMLLNESSSSPIRDINGTITNGTFPLQLVRHPSSSAEVPFQAASPDEKQHAADATNTRRVRAGACV